VHSLAAAGNWPWHVGEPTGKGRRESRQAGLLARPAKSANPESAIGLRPAAVCQPELFYVVDDACQTSPDHEYELDTLIPAC